MVLNDIEGPYLDIAYQLIRAAGYNPTDGYAPRGGPFHSEFEAILIALAYIGARKTDDYGDSHLQEIRSNLWTLHKGYFDIRRKYMRLDQQIEGAMLPDLMETCSDLAVYAVRMIQLLRRLETR